MRICRAHVARAMPYRRTKADMSGSFGLLQEAQLLLRREEAPAYRAGLAR